MRSYLVSHKLMSLNMTDEQFTDEKQFLIVQIQNLAAQS